MLFSKQLPLPSLIEFCRVLRHNLAAGLTLRRVFQQQAQRGPVPVRPVAARVSERIEEGESLEAALKPEKDKFPPLFLSLVAVGEESGSLPEVLKELEKYFLLQQKLQREFLSQIAWPAIEFFMAPFVLAGMIFLLAILSSGEPADPLGFGYKGVSGAFWFLVHFFGTVAALVGLYFLVTRTLKQKAAVDQFLLHLWAIGPCMYALAMTRFCLALRLTMETGMPIARALRLSMRATGNQAFASRAEEVVDSIRTGLDLTQALRQCGLFTEDFLDILANAEEGGRVVEVMAHQADYYEDESRRKMTILTRVASWGFYGLVAVLLIFMIFRMYLRIYINPINQLLK
jgi:type IV pilus assembly protein PilC